MKAAFHRKTDRFELLAMSYGVAVLRGVRKKCDYVFASALREAIGVPVNAAVCTRIWHLGPTVREMAVAADQNTTLPAEVNV